MTELGDKIAIQISSTRTFEPGKAISWSTTVPQDVDPVELNEMLDQLREAGWRQARFHKIEAMEARIEEEVERLAQLNASVHLIDDKYPDRTRAPTDIRQGRQQSVDSIIRIKDLIAAIEENILRLRRQLNGG
jgi:hypothetical protein